MDVEDSLRKELLAITMAKGILESIDLYDTRYIDKEYVKREIRDWIKKREHLISRT